MELRALLRDDDDAVSSVLGVVLMVAVTIILAAVIGTFVLGIGSELTDSSPSASWEFSENVDSGNGSVTIIHGGGDNVDLSTLEITIGGETAFRDGGKQNGYNVTETWDDPVTTGDRLRIEGGANSIDEGEKVRIIWSNGDSSNFLADEQLG